MKKQFIYSLSDPNSGLVRYIGKTTNIKRRLSSHLSNNSLSSPTKKNNWIISLLRNDLLPIIKIIDEVDSDDVDFYEIFYISLFKSWGFDLLNGTIGGDGYDWTGRKHKESSNIKNKMNSPHRKSVAKLDINGNILKKYHSLREAGLDNNISKSHISRACRGIQKTSRGFKWKFIDRITEVDVTEVKDRVIKYKKPRMDSRMKKVCVYDLDGNLIDTCRSINQASIKFNCHVSLVKRCCDEKGYYQTKNLTFRYDGDIFDYVPYKHYRPNKSYNIIMLSTDNEIIMEFKSLKEAVKYTGMCKKTISDRCKLNKSDGLVEIKGYIFRFK